MLTVEVSINEHWEIVFVNEAVIVLVCIVKHLFEPLLYLAAAVLRLILYYRECVYQELQVRV